MLTRSRRSLPHPRLRRGDLFGEALAAVVQRPARSVLTVLGTVLGVGAFVAIVGLTDTASAQISSSFNVLDATTVSVSAPAARTFPMNADETVDGLRGVRSSGVWWQLDLSKPVVSPVAGVVPGSSHDIGQTTGIFAVSPGFFAAAQAKATSGVFFNRFDSRTKQPVCVLGLALARQLGLQAHGPSSTLYINDLPFTVLGVMSATDDEPNMLLGALLPEGTALSLFGDNSGAEGAQMLIRTRLGAAQVVASEVPLVLDPQDPSAFKSVPPSNPQSLRDVVGRALGSLYLALAGLALVIGGVGIANTTLVSVLERVNEIGLRRALGALRRHIAVQFLAESTMLGLFGGLVGSCLGIGTVLIVAIARNWTAVMDPTVAFVAPAVGAATGLLAGIYPALRSAIIEPLNALRR